jgi:sugar (pentulose or hexulose) kinase
VSLIGIDLGTTFIKAGVLDPDTLALQHVRRVPFPDPLPGLPPRYREVDPHAILRAVRELLGQMSAFAADCQGIVLCTQMHGVVWTTEQGEPRSTLSTWQDERVLDAHPSGGGSTFDVLRARLTAREITRLGNELRPGLPIGLLFWLAERGQLPDRALIPASLADFVVANLCGACPETDISNAMATGLLDLERTDWDHEVIGKLGLERVRLPEIRPHGAVTGWLEWGGRRVPCYAPIGDYQCAMLGALLKQDELSLNISTGSQISLLRPQAEFGPFQTRPFFDGRFAIAVTHIPAGRALNALVRLLSELAVTQGVTLADPWEDIARAADAAPPPRMRVNLAFYSSSSGDHGELTNIHEDELTVGHLFRAAFRNMAENYAAFAQQLSPERSWTGLVFSGGLVQKIDLLRRMICDQFGVPYRMSPASEDTLLGLLALGLACTGRTASVAEATAVLSDAYSVESRPWPGSRAL